MLRAYAWVLYDLCKEALSRQNIEEAKAHIEAYEVLNIPADDEMIHTSFGFLKKKTRPEHDVFEQAREQDKLGKHLEAIRMFQSVEASFADDTFFQDAYGWSLYRYLKQRLEEDGKLSEYIKILDKYGSLTNIVPSLLHSQMARLLTKIADQQESFPFLDLFEKWLTKGSFVEDDYKPNEFEGRTSVSLSEKIMMKVGKCLLVLSTEGQVDKFLPLLDNGIQRHPENFWLPYYKAKILIRGNREQEALEYLLPVVKEKRNDYWSWALLGDTFRKTDVDKAISCYCKALLCKTDEKFLTSVRSDFADLLYHESLMSEAKTEYSQVLQARKELGYKIPQKLSSVEQEPWFQAAVSKPHNRGFYQQNKDLAESILFEDIPWQKAIIGESFTTKSEPDVLKTKIYFRNGLTLSDMLVKDRQFRISKRFKEGQSVQIKTEESNGRWALYQLEERSDGDLWDVFPKRIAVIDYVRKDKGIANFICDKTIRGIMKVSGPSELQTGLVVKIRYRSRLQKENTIHEGLTWEPTDQLPVSSVYKSVMGTFQRIEGSSFGFINDIFVPPEFVTQYKLNEDNGRVLKGKAVISFNEKKNSWGWKLVTLDDNVE